MSEEATFRPKLSAIVKKFKITQEIIVLTHLEVKYTPIMYLKIKN